jgi:hypothetical protein
VAGKLRTNPRWLDRIVVDDDEALLMRAVLALGEKGPVLERDAAEAFCKARGFTGDLKSYTEHGSFRHARKNLAALGHLNRTNLGSQHVLTVTTSGVQALRFHDAEERFRPEDPQRSRESSTYLDQIPPAMSPRADLELRLITSQPTVTVLGAGVTIVKTVNAVLVKSSKEYIDSSGYQVVCDATGMSTAVYATNSTTASSNFEAASADFTEQLTALATQLAIDLAEKNGLPDGKFVFKYSGAVTLNISRDKAPGHGPSS